MTKVELVETVREVLVEKFEDVRVTKKAVEEVVEVVTQKIKSKLVEGEEVTLPNLGKLKVVVKKGREGINNLTGKPYKTEDGRKVKFVETKGLKESL